MRRVFVSGIESVSELNVIGHKLIMLHLSFLHVSDEEGGYAAERNCSTLLFTCMTLKA